MSAAPAAGGWDVLADGVLLLHGAFVAFAVLGGLLVWWRPRWAWVHLPTALWAVAVELGGWICPLTPLENWLRGQGGSAGYTSGFVDHYLGSLLYPADLSREMQCWLGASVAVLNLAIYARALWVRHRNRPHPQGDFSSS